MMVLVVGPEADHWSVSHACMREMLIALIALAVFQISNAHGHSMYQDAFWDGKRQNCG